MPTGRRIGRNPGQVRFELLVDHAGSPTNPSDDVIIEDFGIIKGSTGRNDDFCMVVLPAFDLTHACPPDVVQSYERPRNEIERRNGRLVQPSAFGGIGVTDPARGERSSMGLCDTRRCGVWDGAIGPSTMPGTPRYSDPGRYARLLAAVPA